MEGDPILEALTLCIELCLKTAGATSGLWVEGVNISVYLSSPSFTFSSL